MPTRTMEQIHADVLFLRESTDLLLELIEGIDVKLPADRRRFELPAVHDSIIGAVSQSAKQLSAAESASLSRPQPCIPPGPCDVSPFTMGQYVSALRDLSTELLGRVEPDGTVNKGEISRMIEQLQAKDKSFLARIKPQSIPIWKERAAHKMSGIRI